MKGSDKGKQSGLPPQTAIAPLQFGAAPSRYSRASLYNSCLSCHAHFRILIFRLGRTEFGAIAAQIKIGGGRAVARAEIV